MHKMLFDTGVRMENHRNKKGELIQLPFEEWHGGVLKIVYWIENPPEPGWRIKFLIGEHEFKNYPLSENERAVRVVAGGMLSDYAVFAIT